MEDNRVIFEFQQMGAYVKVSAIDPVSMVEISIVGAANAPRQHLQIIAMNKLKAAIAKKKG